METTLDKDRHLLARMTDADKALEGLNEREAGIVLASVLLGAFAFQQESRGKAFWFEVFDALRNVKMKEQEIEQ